MTIDRDIQRFGRALQDFEAPENVRNVYAARRTNAQRHNLQHYLQQMRGIQTDLLLVGEAPGHNGCARTGIPFSSEMLVRRGVLGGQLFTARHGYRIATGHEAREQSAAIVWEVLQRHARAALCWNAFCFHPHQPGDPDSNRKPSRREIRLGAPFLQQLLTLFPQITQIVAVGNSAQTALNDLGIDHVKVRHPAHGGKRAFEAGMQILLAPL